MSRTFTLALLALGLVTPSPQSWGGGGAAPQATQKPVLTTLHRFGNDGQGTNPDAGLTLGKDGNFYGTTYGQPDGTTVVYKLTPNGQFTTLYKFTGANQGYITAPLTQGTDDALYGVAQRGGSKSSGTAFRITPDGSLKFIHEFSGADGALPESPLLQAHDGSFYGTTVQGGTEGKGTIFRLTTDGAVTTLHSFHDKDGFRPLGRLAFGQDGAIYGTTEWAGAHGVGTVYRLSMDGASFKMLHNFTGDGGASDFAGLTPGPDGAFYGVTPGGGIQGGGVAYKITPSGVFTTLHKFSLDGHGLNPFASLIVGADGNFYGTTSQGGSYNGGGLNGAGTIFMMTPAGAVTTLYKFHTAFDGFNPYGGITFGPDGALYGTTYSGGAKGRGTIYKLTLPQ